MCPFKPNPQLKTHLRPTVLLNTKMSVLPLKSRPISVKIDWCATTTSTDRPTTLKRAIDTTVIVRDNHTVVIGGLIDDSFTITDYKVPCLGDIPLLGWAFKSTEKGRDKTNLYVFLTPRVIGNDNEAKQLFDQKKGQIDTIKAGKIKLYQKGVERAAEKPPQN